MELVKTRTEPKVTGMPSSGMMTLVGDTKVGKTTLAASFPNSYVLELERKRADRLAFGRIHEVDDLKTFGEVIEAALGAEDIQTIVIDSVDQLAKWMMSDIAKANGVEFINKPKLGVDSRALWGEFSMQVHGMVDYLKASEKLIILVAHRRVAKEDSEGKVIKPAGINVSGAGGDYIAQQSEIIGYMDVRILGGKSVHFLTFRGESQRAIWRSGVDELHDKEIIITKADPYGSFAAAFEKEAARAPAKLVPTKTNTNGGKKR